MGSLANVIPHRLAINQSLRKEAEKLRAHIDEFQKKYEEQYQAYNSELEKETKAINLKLERANEGLLSDLLQEADNLNDVSEAVEAYIPLYFGRQLLYKSWYLNSLLQKSIDEYIGILTDQMSEIGNEISQLEERKELLSRQANVNDIIKLIMISGCMIEVSEYDDASKLLALTSKQYTELSDEDIIQRHTLLNLRTLLEERVSFLDQVKYISWVIEQKRQWSKELKTIRNKLETESNILSTEAKEFIKKINESTKEIERLAFEIKESLDNPIEEIEADIQDCYSRIESLKRDKENKYREKEDVQEEIESMKAEHSSDSWKWEKLHRERRDLSDEIKRLNEERNEVFSKINELKSQKASWCRMRNDTYDIFKEYSVVLITDGQIIKAGNRPVNKSRRTTRRRRRR